MANLGALKLAVVRNQNIARDIAVLIKRKPSAAVLACLQSALREAEEDVAEAIHTLEQAQNN